MSELERTLINRDKPTTLVDPDWRLLTGRRTVEGIKFISYGCGVLRYTAVSEDGSIRLQSTYNYKKTINCQVLGHGWITSKPGRVKRFHTEQNAVKAAIKIMKGMKP